MHSEFLCAALQLRPHPYYTFEASGSAMRSALSGYALAVDYDAVMADDALRQLYANFALS